MSQVDAPDAMHERPQWRVKTVVDKYWGDWSPEEIEQGVADDACYEHVEVDGNLLLIGGASAIWQRLIGVSVTAFDAGNSHLGVGDSTTAAADTQTDLMAATNKLRKAMDASHPAHSDSTSAAGAKTITFKSTFATGDANFAWQEWGIFNAASGGRMLNRKVESLGTKTSAATWSLTTSVSLA